MSDRKIFAALGGLVTATIVSTVTSPAHALELGTYDVFSHPDGGLNPPPYCLRLKQYTFDCSHEDAGVWLSHDVAAKEIKLWGTVYGGKQDGDTYDPTKPQGLFDLEYTFTNVKQFVDDDDFYVDQTGTGSGSLTPLFDTGGKDLTYVLTSKYDPDRGYAFRFGDEDNDAGHRELDGISGWGWLCADGKCGGTRDLLFYVEEKLPDPDTTPTPSVPEPSSILGLMALAGLFRKAALRRNHNP